MTYKTIKVKLNGRVATVTLNRPKALNALNAEMLVEILKALEEFEVNDKIGCVVITGSEKAFAAGADISEMSELSYQEAFSTNFLAAWDSFNNFRKPVIAAVSGYALGGGCELAMMCDFIIAADNAKFGQPEVTLGIMPGIGGTQRLVRAIGKAKAMEMCLTGRLMDAKEAEQAGLVANIVPTSNLIKEVEKTADKIAEMSLLSTIKIKAAISHTFESSLTEGILYERQLFHSTFASKDQKEGMKAFLDKRTPKFQND